MVVEIMENEEEDVPEDFFDDFDKTEFLDPLTILDTWSGDTQEEESEHREENKKNEKPKKKVRKLKSKTNNENDFNLERESRHNRSKSREKEREWKRSRSPFKRARSRDRHSRSTRSIERKSGFRKKRSTSLQRRSVSLQRISRLDRSGSHRRRSRSRGRRSVSRRRRSRSTSSYRRMMRSKDNFLKRNRSHSRNLLRSRSRERRIRSRDRQESPKSIYDPYGKVNHYEKHASNERKDEDLKMLRRDPMKTKRDILRDKDKCAKNLSDKRISQRLKAVETGLIPPGLELDVELDEVNKDLREVRPRSISYGKRPSKSMDFSLSPSPAKVRRTDHYNRQNCYKDKEDSLERKINKTLKEWSKTYSHLMPRRDRSISRKSRSPSRKKTSFLDEINKKLSLSTEQDKLRHIQEKINGVDVNILTKYTPIPQNLPCTSYPSPYTLPYQTGYTVMPYQNECTGYGQFPNHDPLHNHSNYDEYVQNRKLETSKQKLKNMFTDDKVNFTDYLTASARLLSQTTTVDIKDKIQVITRCQDALKLITDGTRPIGRFFYKKPHSSANKFPDIKNQSPMKSVPCVRFYFTTKMKIDENLKSPISKLLVKMGLKFLPPLQPETIESFEEPTAIPSTRRDFYPENVLMKMTQTSPMICDVCEYRNNKSMRDVGTQCGSGINNSADFGVQVDVDDFHTARSALKNMIKSQSFASLTPAQLMAQLGTKQEDKKELFPLNRRNLEEFATSPSKINKQTERQYSENPFQGKELFPTNYTNPANPSSRNMDNFGPRYNYDQYMNPQPRRF